MGYVASRGVWRRHGQREHGADSGFGGSHAHRRLKHGMIWTESVTGMSQLPPLERFLLHAGPEICGAIASEARAFPVIGSRSLGN